MVTCFFLSGIKDRSSWDECINILKNVSPRKRKSPDIFLQEFRLQFSQQYRKRRVEKNFPQSHSEYR